MSSPKNRLFPDSLPDADAGLANKAHEGQLGALERLKDGAIARVGNTAESMLSEADGRGTRSVIPFDNISCFAITAAVAAMRNRLTAKNRLMASWRSGRSNG